MTDQKLALLLAALAWLLLGRQAVPTRREWRAVAPSLAFLLAGLLSALLASQSGDESVRFVARLAAAPFALLLVLRVARDPQQLRGVLWAVVIGAGISGCLGIGEAFGWSWLAGLLGWFKVAPTRVGGELRVSASFQYATIAAMYFEMAAPLAIVLAAQAARRWVQLAGLGLAVICTANVVLSLTRAGMLTLVVVFGLLLLAPLLWVDWRRLLLPALASSAVLLGGMVILAARDPVFDMRLVTESDADWYGAAYSAPASLRLDPAQLATVQLDVKNEGRIVWSASEKHPFELGYRWLTADGSGVLDVPSGEVALGHDVAPGETIHLQPQILVPPLPAGAYRLDWGMLQRDVLQFYERGWADAETVVSIGAAADGLPVAMPAVVPRDDGEAPWVVGRLELWSAAVRLIQAHPLLGVGPDNFRHLYGAELGLETWDERVQANNLYLEILADTGVLGLAAFLWLVLEPLAARLRRLAALRLPRRQMPTHPERSADVVLTLGLVLGVVAFLVHGLLDTFLAFTPTAVLFWMLLGLLLSVSGRAKDQKPQVSGR